MKIKLGEHLGPSSVKTDGRGDALFPPVIKTGAFVKSVNDIF